MQNALALLSISNFRFSHLYDPMWRNALPSNFHSLKICKRPTGDNQEPSITTNNQNSLRGLIEQTEWWAFCFSDRHIDPSRLTEQSHQAQALCHMLTNKKPGSLETQTFPGIKYFQLSVNVLLQATSNCLNTSNWQLYQSMTEILRTTQKRQLNGILHHFNLHSLE